MGEVEAVTLCPGCGYDLRGAVGDRCSECGLVVDPEALRESGFPWAHRGKIGRVRAYVRTVWGVAADRRALRFEAARPQEGKDGRAFRWVTAGIVATVLLTVWARIVGLAGGLESVAYQPMVSAAMGGRRREEWVADFAVPWSAGATMGWVIPVCLVLLAIYLTGVQQAVFRVGKFGEAYRRRAGAIAHYAAGPLAWLLPGLVCLQAAQGVKWAFVAVGLALATAGALMALIAPLGTLVRVGQWVRRVRHGGVGTAVLAAIELLGLWVLGVVLILGVVPWSVGYIWIVIDSYR